MTRKVYRCPTCGRDSEFVRYLATEVVVAAGDDLEGLYKAPVQRVVLIRCPEHGEIQDLSIGHHIDEPDGSGKRRRRTGKISLASD
jgi:hypothetical protein